MKKKLFALVALVVIFALGLTACGGKNDATSGDDNSFSYWVSLPSSIATRVNSLGEIAMYQKREADSGVHIDFIHPAQGQDGEQFNLMVASGEYPDMIEYNWATYTGGAQKAIDDGVIIPLNKYLDKMPNFKKRLEEGELAEIYKKGCMTDEGDIFAFPNFNVGDVRTFAGPMIRKDWLDELGLEIPVTIDDWTEVLTAFKEKKNVSTPFTALNQYFTTTNTFNGAYGVGQRLYLDGETVKFGPLEEGYKQYLMQLNEWFEAGLIDKDYPTNKRDVVDSKITTGGAGATSYTLGGAMGVYLKQMETKDPSYNLVCAPYPVLNEGETNDFLQMEGDVFGASLAITTACKNPEKLVEWIDYWYSDEGYYMVNFGVEGDSYNMVDGKPVYTDKILKNPDGLSIAEALGLSCRATSTAPGLRQAPEYLEQYYQYQQQIDGFNMWSENIDGVRKTTLPGSLSPTIDEREELASLETNINTYVEEMCFKFVNGSESFDNYDKFIQELKDTFNVERYIEIQQNMYNRYLKR